MRWTQLCSHRSHYSHRGPDNHRIPLHGCVRYRTEEALFAMLYRCPDSVGCCDPGCVCNPSGTVWPRSYEALGLDCYLDMITLENVVRIVVQSGLITCCTKPVEAIDWLSLSRRWHVAYIVAASPNPQPQVDVLYKDLIYHVAVTKSHSLLPMKAANMLVMHRSNQMHFQLPYIQHQKSLMLHWC